MKLIPAAASPRLGVPAWLLAGLCLCASAGLTTPVLAHVLPQHLYQSYCAACHGTDRMGGLGPPLMPEDLVNLPRNQAADVIAKGLAETHMPGFSDELSTEQIDALVRFVYARPAAQARRAARAYCAASRRFEFTRPWMR